MGPQRPVDMKKILELKQQGMTVAAIHRRLGYDAKTIRKVLAIKV